MNCKQFSNKESQPLPMHVSHLDIFDSSRPRSRPILSNLNLQMQVSLLTASIPKPTNLRCHKLPQAVTFHPRLWISRRTCLCTCPL